MSGKGMKDPEKETSEVLKPDKHMATFGHDSSVHLLSPVPT